MESIHYLNEEHIFIFLLQIFVLLTLAKILGSFFYKKDYPALVGEILTGILLGPTILGRFFPQVFNFIFPADLVQQNMLETVSWFGVLFLLLSTGFEIRISSVWKQGKTSLIIGSVGVFIPIIIGVGVFWRLSPEYWGENANHWTFTLFLATAAAISAIPIIAKVLHDIDILKSDLGLTILSAFVINDLLGWFIFTFILGFSVNIHQGFTGLLYTICGIIIFGGLCLTVGNKLVGKFIKFLKKMQLPEPATTLTFITCLAMLSGAITQWIGIHSILGFFLAGIMVGNTSQISERTKEIISQMIHSVFVPIFFATISIRIDFFSHFDVLLVALFSLVALGGKFVGAWIGGISAKLSKQDSFSLGIAHIPGGAMEIIIGMLALELHLITTNVFVAIVFAAVLSSIVVGPLLSSSVKQRAKIVISSLLLRKAVINNLFAQNRWQAIPEIIEKAASQIKNLNTENLTQKVLEREKIMGTGVGKHLAIPHARIKGLKKPVIAFAKSKIGIEWDARDGLPINNIFLVLTPQKKNDQQLQILSHITKIMSLDQIQENIISCKNDEALFTLLKKSFQEVDNIN